VKLKIDMETMILGLIKIKQRRVPFLQNMMMKADLQAKSHLIHQNFHQEVELFGPKKIKKKLISKLIL